MLRRATELDVQLAHRAGLLSPAQVEQAAMEAGISQAAVRQAIAELSGEHQPESTASIQRQHEAERRRRRITKAMVRAPLALGAAIAFGGAVNVGFDPQLTVETVSVYAVGGGVLSGVAALLTRWESGGPGRARLRAVHPTRRQPGDLVLDDLMAAEVEHDRHNDGWPRT